MTIHTIGNNTDHTSRTVRLKTATKEAHEELDRFIMQANPFADREHYGRFLAMQFLFHRDLDALFFDPYLAALLPDLAGRRRLTFIHQDFSDLGIVVPDTRGAPRFAEGTSVDLSEALGWLYVIEGSNLGAAFLLKYAGRIGLDEEFGARHLAGASEGRGLHWKTFTAALDAVDLNERQEQRIVQASQEAFARVRALAQLSFPAPASSE
ncbi:biliverdin-producing heme oxygenase [Agrobacterium sp. OT33]|uniref:biliverdin-producing heme oxygenase n=1 Tax=Agrobacterium sp. OT33 TaxID=2815338 RepID=UPI001A8ECDA0|nr:biliverdin-producing heme oxygenase [Agrobacterium sp. OT33]MBO0128366.1 biliverdin-producing heme oxygenase [Agrobacterium sp. OT33]